MQTQNSGDCENLTWNDKNLDYEIETNDTSPQADRHVSAWNDKNLDYEIETYTASTRNTTPRDLKR